MKRSSILVTIALLGFINVFAWLILTISIFSGHYDYSNIIGLSIEIFALLIFYGFIAGLGFSFASLLVLYVKNHLGWK